MKYLSQFTPTQAQFIIDHGSSSLSTLLKTNFADLLTNHIIEVVKKRKIQSYKNRKSKTINLNYVKIGKNFENYDYNKYDEALLHPFLKDANLEIRFSHFVRMAYTQAYTKLNYKRLIIKDEKAVKYFSKSILYRLFNFQTLNNKGRQMKYDLIREVKEIDKHISQLLKENPKQGLQEISNLGGYFLLLPHISKKTFKDIDPELLKSFKLEHSSNLTSTTYFHNDSIRTFNPILVSEVLDYQYDFQVEGNNMGHSVYGSTPTDSSSNFDGFDFSCGNSCGSSCGSSCGGGCGGCGGCGS